MTAAVSNNLTDSIVLRSGAGAKQKEILLVLEPDGAGHRVLSTATDAAKRSEITLHTEHPVPLAEARAIFERQLLVTTGKGYAPIDQRLMQQSLYFTEGSSDKEYHLQLAARGTGFVVDFQYGRRGSSLTSGCKTAEPVSYEQAAPVYAKLALEKMGKGYTPGVSGVAFQDTPNEKRATGVVPQLLNEANEGDLESLLRDPRWMGQQKFDGKRITVTVTVGGRAQGGNRLGLEVALPLPVANALEALQLGGTFDGEMVGNTYHVFDLIELGGQDLRGKGALDRHLTLTGALAVLPPVHAEVVRLAFNATTAEAKRDLHARLRAGNEEGMVFKLVDAPYTPGRPNAGGDQLKLKFWESASCVVDAVHPTKRSVSLALHDAGGASVPVGNVTIPANVAIPAPGDVVEIKYLYAYPGGSIYQPQYLGPRDDVLAAACALAQLKYKAGSVPGADVDPDGEEPAAAPSRKRVAP